MGAHSDPVKKITLGEVPSFCFNAIAIFDLKEGGYGAWVRKQTDNSSYREIYVSAPTQATLQLAIACALTSGKGASNG